MAPAGEEAVANKEGGTEEEEALGGGGAAAAEGVHAAWAAAASVGPPSAEARREPRALFVVTVVLQSKVASVGDLHRIDRTFIARAKESVLGRRGSTHRRCHETI